MDINGLQKSTDWTSAGKEMHALAAELYPICRSITGEGVRKTLQQLKQLVPLEIVEVPTGTQVFDWTVPREWNIFEGYIADLNGKRVVDFQNHSLHVLNYSTPVRQRISRSELQSHLYTLPDKPDLIPYKTTYYRENWGFCLSDNQAEGLTDNQYEVVIDSSLEDGHLTYAELFLPGESKEEFLFSTHCCHPSLANDNLSGIVVMTQLAKLLSDLPRRYGYRFVFVPGTIGSITWLAQNETMLDRIRFGLVTACVGDPGRFHYKRSRRGNAEIDRAVEKVLSENTAGFEMRAFSPYGYDERQYCSPAFDLPVGHLSRTPHGEFDAYHTSADNLDFITPDALAGSLRLFVAVVATIEGGRYYRNTCPKGEPQLGRRGLYSALGGHRQNSDMELALLWVLNLSDGRHATWDIAHQAGLPLSTVEDTVNLLLEHNLLEPV